MDENDHYAAGGKSGLWAFGVVLLIALAAVAGIVIYTRSPDDVPPAVVRPDPNPIIPGAAAPQVQP